jgi:hypothetical protein
VQVSRAPLTEEELSAWISSQVDAYLRDELTTGEVFERFSHYTGEAFGTLPSGNTKDFVAEVWMTSHRVLREIDREDDLRKLMTSWTK